MKRTKLIQLTTHFALATVAAMLAGCASGNYQKGSSTSEGLTESAAKVEAGKAKIDAAVTALNALVSNPAGDLVPQFKTYTTAVSDLESTAKHVSKNVADMRESGNAYLKAWDEQLALIKNEDIKSRSAERKTEVQTKFTAIKKSYEETSMAFKPFMAELKDVQTALNTDLTPGGIKAIKPVADRVNKDVVPLKAAMDKLVADFKSLGVAMASAPQPAK